MDALTGLFALLLAGSLALNFYLYRQIKHPKKTTTYDATALLRDLMRGNALVKITPIDAGSVFLRAQKDISE